MLIVNIEGTPPTEPGISLLGEAASQAPNVAVPCHLPQVSVAKHDFLALDYESVSLVST
jgi:hypothetical protein